MKWFNDIIDWVSTFPEPWPGVILVFCLVAFWFTFAMFILYSFTKGMK